MTQRGIGSGLMAVGDERFGRQAGDAPFRDLGREPQELRTFREHVEAGELPKGYQGALELRTEDDGTVVIQGQHRYLGELANIDLARMMAGTQLRWRFEMAPKH